MEHHRDTIVHDLSVAYAQEKLGALIRQEGAGAKATVDEIRWFLHYYSYCYEYTCSFPELFECTDKHVRETPQY